ncbi:MAG: hypothetical protein K2O22_02085 [Anaeroplasmataceae bacterium]|nr:hypothetical protein [Anaeroplasmataceae bacterium]
MKRDEQKLLQDFQESLEQTKSFEDIEHNIMIHKQVETSKRSFWTPKKVGLSLAGGSILLLLIVLIPFLFMSSSAPEVTNIRITNRSDLLVEYEKNCSFISKGVLVDKEMSDGSVVRAEDEEVIVDYEEFTASKVGRYHISVYLKEYPEIKAGYDVSVVDDEIVGLNLIEFRSVYYQGEQITSEDLVLEKELASGKKKRAKLVEYSIEGRSVLVDSIGMHKVGVVLNSNEEFQLSYEVDVKSLEELNIDGKYGYTDKFSSNYSYDVLAIEIHNAAAIPYDSEVVISGELKKEILNNEIVISDLRHNQNMIYKPFTKQLIIKGIAGDPDIVCFKLTEEDYLISLTGPLVEGSQILIARGGKLSNSTLMYLIHSYGGVYMNESLEVKIDTNTIFNEDTTIYLQARPIDNDQKEYMGIWYDDGVVKLEINEEGLFPVGSTQTIPYTIEESMEGYRIRISSFEVFEYSIVKDTVEYYAEGYHLATYKRFNRELQAIVSVYPTNSRVQWVVNKGDTLKMIVTHRNNVTYYTIPNYHGEPILEDRDFGKITEGNWYISDMDYDIYGTLKNYVHIVGAWSAGKPTIDKQSTNYLQVYKNYELIEVGWIEIIDADQYDITILVHFEDDTTEKVYYNRQTRILKYKEEEFEVNKTSFKGLEITGDYIGEDGSSKTIDEVGRINYEIYYPSGYIARGNHRMYIQSMEENSIVLWYTYQNSKDEREIRTLEFTKENDIWTFVYDGIIYHKQAALEDN